MIKRVKAFFCKPSVKTAVVVGGAVAVAAGQALATTSGIDFSGPMDTVQGYLEAGFTAVVGLLGLMYGGPAAWHWVKRFLGR